MSDKTPEFITEGGFIFISAHVVNLSFKVEFTAPVLNGQGEVGETLSMTLQ